MTELFGNISPVVILVMIPGLVQMVKSWFAWEGKQAEILTVVIALLLGVGLQLQEIYASVVGVWFNVGLYSVLFALTAAGYYKMADRFTAKG
jgi:hypothetical protein